MIRMITPLTKEEFATEREAVRASGKLFRCMAELKTELREMIFALDIFEPVAIKEKLPLFTNGRNLFYSPELVLKEDASLIKHRILHIAFHALLGHISGKDDFSDKELAWAVMDLKTERMIRFLYSGEADDESDETGGLFGKYSGKRNSSRKKESVGFELYYKSVKNQTLRKKVLESGKGAVSDDHHAWSMIEISGNSEAWKEAAGKFMELFGDGKFLPGRGESFEDFINSLMETDKRAVDYGKLSGGLARTVMMDGGDSTDYRDILGSLRRTAVTSGEEDIPDPVFYSYGLELYGDIPLVEPLEESEKPCIDTLALVVDTSGSCADRLPVFLRETDALLEELRQTVNIRKILYMECDSVIQKELLIEGSDIRDFLGKEHTYEGYGGTDFRPVFERIEEYREAGNPVECLLYYSDGEGDFPEERAGYPCYFILPERNASGEMMIPYWIEKKYLGY